MTWGARLIGSRTLLSGATTDSETFRKEHGDAIRADALKLVASMIRTRDPGPSFLQLLTFRIQRWFQLEHPAPDTHSYRYWKENGWLEPARRFVIETPVGFWKSRAACTLASVVEKLLLH